MKPAKTITNPNREKLQQVRHNCNAVLFESRLPAQSNFGLTTDFTIKCTRCSRRYKNNVLVSFKLKLPRWIAPSKPQPVRCQNPECLARLCDISLPCTFDVDDDECDIAVLCHRCKRKTKLKLSGIATIEE